MGPDFAARIIGAWLLEDWQILTAEEAPTTRPFGDEPLGLLLYSADGWMSAQINSRSRSAWSHGSARRATAESKLPALDECMCYSGRWWLEGSTIVHSIRQSLNPVLIGSRQVRQPQFDGDRMRLTALEEIGGRSRKHEILWVRSKSTGVEQKPERTQ
ncbi:MAG: lipocalin-like domain-containing protein [Steroidobacteraceae bacterium]